MANKEHLAILRQGVEVWNQWRREQPHVEPDLTNAQLQDVSLPRVNLRLANLRQANFQFAVFVEADLTEAILIEADLRGASLQGANLQRSFLEAVDLIQADMTGADLTGASLVRATLEDTRLWGTNLTRAILSRANFSGTDLWEANMLNAVVGWTIFSNLNLQHVQGLDTIQHYGPSTIGMDTLYKSEGRIPQIFLRGCGIPDSMIEYARSLVLAERPIDYYSCFISYSSEDQACAERLYADLQARGVRCWLAPHDLTPGEVIVRGIDEAIRLHDKVVLLLSKAAVASPWVAFEVNLATTREAREGCTVLYPLRLDDAVLITSEGWAVTLREARHIGDFRGWKDHDSYQTAFTRLLRDLKAEQQ